MTINLALPTREDAGQLRRWYLPIKPPGDREEEFQYHVTYARFLGLGTSFAETHSGHRDREFVDRGTRCNACRWFETRVFRELVLTLGGQDVESLATDDLRDALADARLGDYVLHSVGMSIVDGEVPYCKVDVTTSPFSVVELMTTRRVTDQGPQAFIAKPAAYALSEASGRDRDLADAYINRAVS